MQKIGEILKKKRAELGLTLDIVSKETKIPLDKLLIVERGLWHEFSSWAYLQGIVAKYAVFLKLNHKNIVALLRREIEKQDVKFIRRTKYQEQGKFLSSNIYFFVFLFLFVVFFAVQLVVFWQKPLLSLQPIPSRVQVNQPLVVKGKTEPGALLYLNDERVYQDEKGFFSQELYFKKGKREITIRVLGTNGREVVKTFEVEVK